MKPSGIEWIGDIPDDWEVTKISRLYSIQLGKMLQPEKKSSGDTYEPYICAANLSSGTFRLDEVKYMWISEPEKDIYRLKRDDLLVTEGGDVGISSIWKDDISPCYFQNALHRVVPKKGNSNRFLHYWLIVLKSVGYIDLICNKSTIAHFTKEKFAQSLILSAPLQTQQRIADYLDEKCGEIDATIAKQKESIEKLKAYKQSLISETVTKGLDKSAPLKPSGIKWLGEIPQNARIIRLRFLSSIQTGDKDTANRVENGKYPFYVRSPIVERIDTFSFDGEAILMAGDGVGAGKVFHYVNGKFDYHQRVYNIHNLKGVLGKFLYYYLRENFYKEIEQSNAKSTVDSIRLPMLLDFPIIVYPYDLQKEMVSFLDKKVAEIDAIIIKKQNIIQKLDAYKKSLIFECVTGKKRI